MKVTRDKLLRAVREPGYLLEVAGRRIENARSRWLRRNGHASPPRMVNLFLTNLCNLRCFMCGQYGEAGKSFDLSPEFLPEELAFRVIDELAPFGTSFTLQGGEPAMHPEWRRIAERTKSHDLWCDMITNGTFLARDAEALLESGMDLVNVSLDGPQDVHDRVRGVPGTYEKVVRGVDRLLSLRAERGLAKPELGFYFTINQYNYGQLVSFAEWAEKKGADRVLFYHLRFFDKTDYEENAREMQKHFGREAERQEGFVFDAGHIDTDVLTEEIKTLRSRTWKMKVEVGPNYPLEELDAYYHAKNYRRGVLRNCAIPWIAASVSPNCYLMPCLDYPGGDLREHSFLDLWNGKQMRRFRRVLMKVKRFPVCHRCCN